MNKDKVIEILTYYLPENTEYLYYENHMYPTRLKRDDLVRRMADDICKDEEPPEDGCAKTCQCCHE
jgi:hypothetical protein